MKHKAKPLEFGFTAEVFALEIQTADDGARTQRERDQARADRKHADQQQLKIEERPQ